MKYCSLQFICWMRKVWIHHMMSQRSYFCSSKLRLTVSKGGANSADLDALGLYF